MQVVEVGIRVDIMKGITKECFKRAMVVLEYENYPEDTFGECETALFPFINHSAFQYKFVERPDAFYPGVDHIAIAVRDLNYWTRIYRNLGFIVVYGKRPIFKTHSLIF